MITGKVKRQDLFIVTKLPMFALDPSAVRPTVEQSLKHLCIDYLDLYLIHGPIAVEFDREKGTPKQNAEGKVVLKLETDHIGIWREMEKLVDEGKIRSIGVSNFNSLQVLVLNMSLDSINNNFRIVASRSTSQLVTPPCY